MNNVATDVVGDFVGEEFQTTSHHHRVYIDGDMGGGSVFLERRNAKAEWARYPEMIYTVTVANTTANPFTVTLPATAFNSEADISVIDNATLGVLDAPEHYSIAGDTITFVNTVRDQLVTGDKIKIIYSEQV